MELIDSEVILRQKELLVNTVVGVLKNKTEYMIKRAIPQVSQVNLPLPRGFFIGSVCLSRALGVPGLGKDISAL